VPRAAVKPRRAICSAVAPWRAAVTHESAGAARPLVACPSGV
jgi:hypothetical protein